MPVNDQSDPEAPLEQLDYLLRRAEQESIAAIRTIDARAAAPHARMACAYTDRALSLLEGRSGPG